MNRHDRKPTVGVLFPSIPGGRWGGLVAVAESQRGKKIGRCVNVIDQRNIHILGAEMIYELVSFTNPPSRRMVEACGLSFDPTVRCAGAVRQTPGWFAR